MIRCMGGWNTIKKIERLVLEVDRGIRSLSKLRGII